MSQILHLLASRPTTSVSEECWKAIQGNASLQKWMKLKLRQFRLAIGMSLFVECVVTIVLVLGMNLIYSQTFQPDSSQMKTTNIYNILFLSLPCVIFIARMDSYT